MKTDCTEATFPHVSVVIPVLNAARTIGAQLEALSRQVYRGSWEVVIADNGSDDGSVAEARKWADHLPDLDVVSASGRRGVNHARNVGIGAARGEIVLLCDADDTVGDGWLAAMADASLHDGDIVGGATRWSGSGELERLPVAEGFLPYAVGANMGMRRSVWEQLGGLNETYIGGGDEVEFCWRAQLAGYRLSFVPDAIVVRQSPRTAASITRKAFFYGIGEARLLRDFTRAGLTTALRRQGARRLVWCLARGHWLLSSASRRREWLWRSSFAVGKLCGILWFWIVPS